MPGMRHHPACPSGRHVHLVRHVTLVDPGCYLVVDDASWMAIATTPELAERIVELLDRHGLADVPDDASAITAPWPAPNPDTRQETP